MAPNIHFSMIQLIFSDSLACWHRSDHAQHGGDSSRHPRGLTTPGPELHQLQPGTQAPLSAGALCSRGAYALTSKNPSLPVRAHPAPHHLAVGRARRGWSHLLCTGRPNNAKFACWLKLKNSGNVPLYLLLVYQIVKEKRYNFFECMHSTKRCVSYSLSPRKRQMWQSKLGFEGKKQCVIILMIFLLELNLLSKYFGTVDSFATYEFFLTDFLISLFPPPSPKGNIRVP